MKEGKDRKMRGIEYSVFRIPITLLGFTGLRIIEIRNSSREQFFDLLDQTLIQIYQSKQTLLLTTAASKGLTYLKMEGMSLFYKRESLAGGTSPSSWISFINKKLRSAASQHRLSIKSHSFRINFITSLLKFAPIQ